MKNRGEGGVMKKSTVGRLHLIYGIGLSILLIAVGICLIGSCITIYNSGENPFSRESVAEQFEKISVLVYGCIAAVVIGAVLTLVFPAERPRLRGTVDPEKTISKLLKRIPDADIDPQQRQQLRHLAQLRFGNRIFGTCVCILCAIPPLLYLLTPENFTLDHLNSDIFSAIRLVLLCSAIAFGICIAMRLLNDRIRRRQIDLLKSVLASGTHKNGSMPTSDNCDLTTWTRREVALTLALSLFALGLFLCLFALIFADFSHSLSSSALLLLSILSALVLAAVLIIAVFVCGLSRDHENKRTPDTTVSHVRYLTAVRIAVLTVAVLFIVLGIRNGGMGDVLAKAIRICTECIGLG